MYLVNVILYTFVLLKISSVWKMGKNKCDCLFLHKFKSPNLYFYIHGMRKILLKRNKNLWNRRILYL